MTTKTKKPAKKAASKTKTVKKAATKTKAVKKTKKAVKNTVVRPKPFTSWRPDRPAEDVLNGVLVFAGGHNLLTHLLYQEKICLKSVKGGLASAIREIKEATKSKNAAWLKQAQAYKLEDERSVKTHIDLVSLLTQVVKLYKIEQHW